MNKKNLWIRLHQTCLIRFKGLGAFGYGGLLLCACVLLGTVTSPSALAADANLANGAQVFRTHCAGCHPNGGNIVRRGKTLKLKALNRNGLDSVGAIANLVTNGRNNMPAFKDQLSAQQINDVSTYLLEQAKQGWR